MNQSVITVLLADDHTLVREGLAALIADQPGLCVVGQCGEGLKVVGMVEETKPQVAVLDIGMPGLNGLDVCRELRRKQAAVKVLMLTMHDDEQFVARAIQYGANGYVLKDSAADHLAEAIFAVARGEMFLGIGVSADVLNRLSEAAEDPYERLTPRERQVLQLVAEGNTNRMVAQELGLAIKTVDAHRTRLMLKLNVHNQTDLVKFAMRKGLVKPF